MIVSVRLTHGVYFTFLLSDDTFEKKEYEYGEDDSTHSSAAKKPVEIRVTSGVAERVPVEPVVKAALVSSL